MKELETKKQIEKRINKYKKLPTCELDVILKHEILFVLIDIRDIMQKNIKK